MTHQRWLVVGLIISSVLSGCTSVKPVFVVSTPPAPGVKVPTATPLVAVPLAPGEFVSLQNPNLTIGDMKDSPARFGRRVSGVVTNRGASEYGIVHLYLDFYNAQGAIVGTGDDFDQRLGPGDKFYFDIDMAEGSVRYKVKELSGR